MKPDRVLSGIAELCVRTTLTTLPFILVGLVGFQSAQAAIATDVLIFKDSSGSATSITTGTFSTSSPNELLLAFIATDGVSPGMTVTSVTGAGLSWVLVRRTNAQLGTAEIWRTFATTTLSNVTVTANLAQSVAASITVVSFTGVDTWGPSGAGAIGATGSGNANPGAPTATLVTTRDSAWVWGVGNDWDNAIARTLGPSQTMLHQYLATVGDTYWVQSQTSATPTSGTSVTINDTAPATDRFNLTTVEILPPGPTFDVSGTVFEDVNYGGGAGRDSAAASGIGRPGARVELYDNNGIFASATTTAAGGAYAFSGLPPRTYTVRVVNDSVSSSRTGYVASLRCVQTFRTDAGSGTAIAVTDRVGGQNPAVGDAGAGSAGATLNTATGVFSVGPSGTAQSITSVTLGASNITGVNFGFCFDVIVNKNNTGKGSLRQFITNANALSNIGLAQEGRPAGLDNAIFMLADGTARPGMNTGYATMFVSGVASIALNSALPAVSLPAVIDAQTQPGWSGAPKVELNGASAGGGANGLNLTGGNTTVRGLVIRRFGSYGVRLATAGGDTLSGCYIGTNAAGTAASANTAGGVFVNGVPNVVIGGTSATAGNVISGNSARGINASSASNLLIQGNRIGVNAAGNAKLGNGTEAITLDGCTNCTIGGTAAGAANVIGGGPSGYEGIWIINATSGTTIQGNFIGTDTTGTVNLGNGYSGIGVGNVGSSGAVTNNIIGGTVPGAGNVIAFNGGPGVAVDRSAGGTAVNNPILSNSIYSNTELGIDLDDFYASPSSPGVTANDAGDGDAGGNNRQNFPVLDSALTNGVDTIQVYGSLNSRPDSAFRVQFFASGSADGTGYGEGEVFLGDTTITTNGSGDVAFSATLAAAVAVGKVISATATDANGNTSEFSDTALVRWPATALSVAVSNSTFAFGMQAPNTWLSAQSSVITNDGSLTENLVAQISQLTDGPNSWAISATTNGVDSIRAQWSTTSAAGPWTNIPAYNSNFTIASNVVASDSVTFWLRIQTPSATTSFQPYSSTLTVTAQ